MIVAQVFISNQNLVAFVKKIYQNYLFFLCLVSFSL